MQNSPDKPVQVKTWRLGNIILGQEVEELSFDAGDIWYEHADRILTTAGTADIRYRIHLRGATSVNDAFARFAQLVEENDRIDRPIAIENIEREIAAAKAKMEQQRIAQALRQ